MNTASKVDQIIKEIKNTNVTKAVMAVKIANACLGWAYVFGARGEYCNPANRRSFYNSKKKETIKSKCKNFDGSGSCSGCRWHPGGTTRFFDCRGFTYWVFKQVGITINGAGGTSQFDNNSNWERNGPISEMPKDVVCCVFRYDSSTKKMEHTLLYDGEGHYIHDNGEVRKVDIGKYNATHYAIPKGLYANLPDKKPDEVVIVVDYATVKGGNLNLRSSKSTSSARLASIPDKTKVSVVERGTDWCKVVFGQNTGYVMTKYLTFESESGDTNNNKVTITLSREDATALYEALKLSLNK